jgi:hypothetical protein
MEVFHCISQSVVENGKALPFSRPWMFWRMPSSGVWRRVDVVDWTDVSEDRIAPIFRVVISASEEPAWAGSCSYDPPKRQFNRPTRRHTPEDGILHSHRRENLKSYMNVFF